MFQLQLFFAPLWRMGPRCSSAETQVCHRSYIIAASILLVYDYESTVSWSSKNKNKTELQRGPIRHNGAKKSCSWNIKTHYLRFKHFIITITDDPSPC
jgi:hypothetical protein